MNSLTDRKKIAAALVLCLALAACHGYVVHPGAINKTDSKIYDVMSAVKVIEQEAPAKFTSGDLPASFKPLFNNLMRAYNVALPLYHGWQDAEKSHDPKAVAMLRELTLKIADVKAALAAFNRGTK